MLWVENDAHYLLHEPRRLLDEQTLLHFIENNRVD